MVPNLIRKIPNQIRQVKRPAGARSQRAAACITGSRVERFEEMWFIEGENNFRYQTNYFLRALDHLHIGFTLK